MDAGTRRRQPTEIAYTVISTANGGERKTKIMYGAALNITQLNKYLELLLDRGMISMESGRRYRATEKGRKFLATYDRCMETRSLLRAQEKALFEFLSFAPRRAQQLEAPPLQ